MKSQPKATAGLLLRTPNLGGNPRKAYATSAGLRFVEQTYNHEHSTDRESPGRGRDPSVKVRKVQGGHWEKEGHWGGHPCPEPLKMIPLLLMASVTLIIILLTVG